MSIPVCRGPNPWLTPLFGGLMGIGQDSLDIFLLVTVTMGAPVDTMNVGVDASVVRAEICGGVGEPVPAFAGGAIGTGSALLAAVSGGGVKAGSDEAGFTATGMRSRWPAVSDASSATPLTRAMPVLETL